MTLKTLRGALLALLTPLFGLSVAYAQVGGAANPTATGAALSSNQTNVQATAGSDASKAIAVQGITSGKAIPVSASSLPLPTGAATAAKQPALGTAGAASTDVITVQGIASGVAQPVSGTVAATQSGTWNITNVSGTISLPTGAATSANQTTELGYLDGVEGFISETHGIIGAATAATKMGLIGGVYVSSAPTLTTGQSFGARMDSHGSLVVTCANADGTLCGDTSAVNLTQVAGATITAGLGNVSSGSPRMTTAFPGAVFYNINMSTATTTEIIPLSGSTVTYVLLSKLAVGGTTTVTLKYGTGTNCGTGTTSLEGPYNLTDQNGWVEGNGLAPILTVPAGKALCVTSSAAVQVSGKFGAVQF